MNDLYGFARIRLLNIFIIFINFTLKSKEIGLTEFLTILTIF